MIHPPGHAALRRRIAGGVLGSPQAVGGRLGVSRRPVAARAECLWGGRYKLVDSSAPVRQLAPRTQPARAPNQPGTSRTQPVRSPASPRPCVRVPPGGRLWRARGDDPAPPRARWRTAVTLTVRRRDGRPPSAPPSSLHLHRRHPRRRLASTALAHAAAIPLAALMSSGLS